MRYFFKGYADRYTVNKDWHELCSELPTPISLIQARDEMNKRALRHEKQVPELYLQMVSGWPIRDCEVITEDGTTICKVQQEAKERLN